MDIDPIEFFFIYTFIIRNTDNKDQTFNHLVNRHLYSVSLTHFLNIDTVSTLFP